MEFLIPLLGAFLGSGVAGLASFWLNKRNRRDDRFESVQRAVAEYMAATEHLEVEMIVRFRDDARKAVMAVDEQVLLMSAPLKAYATAHTLASSFNYLDLAEALQKHRWDLGERAKRDESDKAKAAPLKLARDAVLVELRRLSGFEQ